MGFNFTLSLITFALFVNAILSIISTSMSIHCYDNNQSYKQDKKQLYDYLIASLVFTILLCLISLYGFSKTFTVQVQTKSY